MTIFFDAYCALGHLSTPILGQEFPTAAELLAVMSESQIDEALVYSPTTYEYEVNTGNEILMETIRGFERLHPCWVLVPPATNEMLPPAKLLKVMQGNGVRAVRLCPSSTRHNFSLAGWSVDLLLNALAEARIPVFLDLAEVTWAEVETLLNQYKRLPLVLTGVTYRIDRYLYPLWDKHANLFVEISGYQGLQAIEAVVRRFGPERLLFGTNLPTFTPGAAVAAITYADIADEAKALIAGGNLRRLLEATYAG